MLTERFSFTTYLQMLYESVPSSLYVVELSIAFLTGAILLYKYGYQKGIQLLAYTLTLEYIVLLYCSTVFYRNDAIFRKYKIHPFWSYKNFYYHADQILMNVIVFIPLGILFGVMFHVNGWLKSLLAGLVVSVSIEVLQLLFKKGLFQVDDIIHNTIGCLIGYTICQIANKCFTIHVEYSR